MFYRDVFTLLCRGSKARVCCHEVVTSFGEIAAEVIMVRQEEDEEAVAEPEDEDDEDDGGESEGEDENE